jgi:hypothetical protein
MIYKRGCSVPQSAVRILEDDKPLGRVRRNTAIVVWTRRSVRGILGDPVADTPQFEDLRQEFDAIVRDLRRTADPNERRGLLRRMRLALAKMDQPDFIGTSLNPPRVLRLLQNLFR